MGPKDHIWDSTQWPWDRESGPKDRRIQHSWDRETGPKDHIWDSTQLGQENRTQRPYMGFNTVGTGKLDPKTIGFHTVGTGKLDPKTIYGTQRPYMGFNTVGTGKLDPKTIYGIQHSWDRESGPKDHRIQHSWDRKTGPKDHIWDPKTIYGIQHSWDRETGPKDHIWDSIQLGQGKWTQRP